MFDTVAGLPVHALVVHAVVVLLPVAALGALAVALVPRWRTRYGFLVALVATVAVGLVPVASRSGEALEGRVGSPAGDHADVGAALLWYALPLVVLLWLLVAADARRRRDAGRVRRAAPAPRAGGLVAVLAVLTVLAAGLAGYQVVRVGDSGARSVWAGEIADEQEAEAGGEDVAEPELEPEPDDD